MKNFNNLSPAETERLALLLEEMSEASQIIGKILRHGYSSFNPNGPLSNRRMLEMELGHVKVALTLMEESHDVDRDKIQDSAWLKNLKMGKYLHHQN